MQSYCLHIVGITSYQRYTGHGHLSQHGRVPPLWRHEMYQGCQPEQDRAELFNLLSDCFHNIDITATIISDKLFQIITQCGHLLVVNYQYCQADSHHDPVDLKQTSKETGDIGSG